MGLCQMLLAQQSTQQVLPSIRGASCTCCSHILEFFWGCTRRMSSAIPKSHRCVLPAAADRLALGMLSLRTSRLLMLTAQQGPATCTL